MFTKTDYEGKVMWENSKGERLKNPNEKPDKYGWEKTDVNGRVMWKSHDGEISE